MSKRILVTFGRSDPLHLTEATYEVLGEDGVDYIWGPDFNRPQPDWAWVCSRVSGILDLYDVVYCGHGATLLEATAAGCEVMVLVKVTPLMFSPAWGGFHLDHSGKVVEWWVPRVMRAMADEIRDRRGKPPTNVVGGSTGNDTPGGDNYAPMSNGASWVHQRGAVGQQ